MTLLEQMQEIETAKNNIKHSLELKGKNPNDDIRTYSAIINSMDGDVPSAMKIKIIIQDEEPDETVPYEGIWIKSADYTYDNVYIIDNRENKVANSINIIVGKKKNPYKTILLDSDVVGGFYTSFQEILITDENNNVYWDIPIYYGNDTLDEWVDITPSDIHWVGITVDYVNSSITEIDGSYDVDDLLCYANRIRCNLTNTGEVTAYYGDGNYNNNGTEDLQVMVEQPIVYYKVDNIILDSTGKNFAKVDYCLADGPLDGYTIHPAFIRNNQVYKNIYIGAFEGTLVNNKLCSIGDGSKQPLVSNNQTMATFRQYAKNRGTIWNILTKMIYDLEGLMLLMEYKTFNFKSAIGYGVCNVGAMATVGQNYTINFNDVGTGYTNGDKTAKLPFTWRYRENIFGNTRTIVDGLNTNPTNWYYNFVNDNFQDYVGAGTYYKGVSQSKSYYKQADYHYFAYCPDELWIFMPGTSASVTGSLVSIWNYDYESASYRPYPQGYAYNDNPDSTNHHYFSGRNINNGSNIYSDQYANPVLICYSPKQIENN